MPIISDIGSMGNIVISLTRVIIERPLYLIIFLLMVLFFPLNVLDYLMFIFVNFFIAIFNLLVWIIIIPVNILIFILETVLNGLVSVLYFPFNVILSLLGGSSLTPPTSTIPNVPYFSLSYISIDFFGDQDTIFGKIIDGLGLSFPLWVIKNSRLFSWA